MRRPRHRLQVSTFPFLAVLLSAMGALILLLLVIDRQAKIAARKKAQLAQAESAERLKASEGERRAEWERQRQALRDRLDAERRGLDADLAGVRGQTTAAGTELEEELARAALLRKKLAEEEARLLQARRNLEERRGAARAKAEVSAKARDDLSRLAADLEYLEKALTALREQGQREQQVVSLVPYKGRRGDDRKPVYVECAASGVIFHAARVALLGPDFVADKVRAEVERRAGRQQPAPYLLMLVRPDGIGSYYSAMKMLAELKVDFGYELIESDWRLDFPESDSMPAPQWMAAQIAPPGPASAATGSGIKRVPESGGVDPRRDEPGGTFGNAGNAGPNLTAGVKAPGPVGGVPNGSGRPGVSQPSGGPTLPLSPTAKQGAAGAAGIWQQTINATSEGVKKPAAQEQPAGPGAVPAQPWLNPRKAPGSAEPPRSGEAAPQDSAGAQERPKDGQPAAGPQPGDAGGASGQAAGRLMGDPGAGSVRAAPSPLSRLTGNRDWVIFLDCKAGEVVLQPSGKSFAVATIPRGQEHELTRAVREMVARRQATVRQGEPPYRPLIRFRVPPDGVASFYIAYPLLEPLRVPMARQNVE